MYMYITIINIYIYIYIYINNIHGNNYMVNTLTFHGESIQRAARRPEPQNAFPTPVGSATRRRLFL